MLPDTFLHAADVVVSQVTPAECRSHARLYARAAETLLSEPPPKLAYL